MVPVEISGQPRLLGHETARRARFFFPTGGPDADSKARNSMAGAAHVLTRDIGFGRPTLWRLRAVPGLPDEAVETDRGEVGVEGGDGDAPVGNLLVDEVIAEPPSGMRVLARFPNHHTAGYVYTRDDVESRLVLPALVSGSGLCRWWSHDTNSWVSWVEICRTAAVMNLILQPLFGEPPLPGCASDGPCGDSCPTLPARVRVPLRAC